MLEGLCASWSCSTLRIKIFKSTALGLFVAYIAEAITLLQTLVALIALKSGYLLLSLTNLERKADSEHYYKSSQN